MKIDEKLENWNGDITCLKLYNVWTVIKNATKIIPLLQTTPSKIIMETDIFQNSELLNNIN